MVANTNNNKARHDKTLLNVSQVTTFNVRAILSVLDSTSLLLLPTMSYIVVSISCDHPPRASMMMLCWELLFFPIVRGGGYLMVFSSFFSLLLIHGSSF